MIDCLDIQWVLAGVGHFECFNRADSLPNDAALPVPVKGPKNIHISLLVDQSSATTG